MNRFRTGLLSCVAIVCCAPALATDFGDRTPSVGELVEALQPKLLSKGVGSGTASTKAAPSSAVMRIQFDIGSHRIREDSVQILANVATALNDGRLEALPFTVLGHTDVTGSLVLNTRLSRQRADAVVSVLVERGVSPNRLVAQGKGPSDLLPKYPADSPMQRRVEVALRSK